MRYRIPKTKRWEDTMRRREFLGSLAVAAFVAPAISFAQSTPKIGVLIAQSPPHPFPDVFQKALATLGFIDGENVSIEVRYAEGQFERAVELAQELVDLDADIIVAHHTPAVKAAMNATTTIPIVMAPAGAPLQTGLVKDLARPEGNVTGMSAMEAELGGKRLALLAEIIPNLARVAVLGSKSDPFTKPFVADIEAAGADAGIDIQPVLVDGAAEFESAFATMTEEGAQAVMVQPLFSPHTPAIVELATRHKVPILSSYRETTEQGGLISFAGDQFGYFERAADFVDRILKGAAPADLPVEQPTKFHLAINARTADELRLQISPSLFAQADEVFE
jgi:putative tryptophan/tyrosine transport system substrate-binding protein